MGKEGDRPMNTLEAYINASLEELIDACKKSKLIVSCEKADKKNYWLVFAPFPDGSQDADYFIHKSDIKTFLCGILIGDRLNYRKTIEVK
jgi:hypothetical protein